MADKSSGDVVNEAATESVAAYRAENPGLRSIEEADADAKAAEKEAAKNAPRKIVDLPTGEHSHQ